jgi:solute carrier family 6 (neurotransmitter transporter)
MSGLYMCFNLFISIIATIYFMTIFGSYNQIFAELPFPDISGITSIYDRAFGEVDIFRNLIPNLGYLMILLTSFVSLSITLYTVSQLFREKTRSLLCLLIMLISILCLLYPQFYISQLLDFKWTGIFIVCAVIFKNIGLTWIYGTKILSIDLEFSIGRPIKRFWFMLWTTTPVTAAIILTFHMVSARFGFHDILEIWFPLMLCAGLFIYFAIYETLKQIDYNIFNKIRESTLPTKDFGPSDPLVRHAWKNWKTVSFSEIFLFQIFL